MGRLIGRPEELTRLLDSANPPHTPVTCSVILQEKRKLQDEAEAMSDRLSDETESRKKMADKLSHERHQNQKEKEATQEVRTASRCQVLLHTPQ